MSNSKPKTKRKARTGESDFQSEINRIIEGAGYTPDERIRVCLETIDLSLARARQSAREGTASGSCAFAALAEKMISILANLEARSERKDTDNKRLIGWAALEKSESNG